MNVYFVFAQKLYKEEAKLVAQHFCQEKQMKDISDLLIVEDEALYVFGDKHTFLILSGDRRIYPVLAYSKESSWEESRTNPHFNWIIKSYKKEIAYILNSTYQAPENIKKSWKRYLQKSFVSQKSTYDVTPMLQAAWSQGCHYNVAFPIDSAGPCHHPFTGCVATAMGQVMHYYQYPAQGSGSHTYNSYYGELTANYEDTHYQWDAMPNHLDEDNEALSQLLLHCAIAVDMVFLPNGQGSGAYDNDIPNALVHFFDYDTTARYVERNSYPGNWKWMLINELEMGRPVIYGALASEENAGHSFVCDGFQDTTHFHINWGWDGYGNGYFLLDSLTLSDYHFDQYHDAIIGINPQANGIEEKKLPEFTFFTHGNDIYISSRNDLIESCQLFDIQGIKLVSATDINASQYQLHLTDLTSSIYILRLRIQGKWYSQKWYVK
jgi:hypothetical protein